MIELFRTEYWSKSQAFLLPLTGIPKSSGFEVTSYVRWNNYSLQQYNLIVKIEYGHRFEAFQEFFSEVISRKETGFVTEVYDYEGFSVLIYDVSYWAADIRLFSKGKYSKMSKAAKEAIELFHIFYKDNKKKINVKIYSCLNPKEEQLLLDNMTAIAYAAVYYDIELDDLEKIGEICSCCEPERETLVLQPSQVDIPILLD
jgi:hypothetical protein